MTARYSDRSQCEGKVPYPTKTMARRALGRVQGADANLRPYKCPTCGWVHLGHRPPAEVLALGRGDDTHTLTVACPVCHETTEMPCSEPVPTTEAERREYVERYIEPFRRMLQSECHFLETFTHSGRPKEGARA